MRIGMARIMVFAGTVLALGSPSLAVDLNGFLKPKGHGDLAVSVTAESYDEFWRGEQRISTPGELGEIENRSLSLWLAYGLTEDLTLFATLPYVDTEGDGTAGFDESGLQDVSALVAYRLLERQSSVRHDLIGAVGLRTPASDYTADQPVAIGDSTTDWLLRIVYLLRAGSFYVSQQVGYDVRGEDAPDGWPLFTELGYTHSRVTYGLFYANQIVSDGSDIGDAGFTFPGNREEYERIGAKVYGRVAGRFGLTLSVFDTLDGRNTGNSSGVSLGAVFGF